MKKVIITILLSSLLSMWVFGVVVPMSNSYNGGDVVLTGDPHPHDEWD